jgi:hypothetical protein
MPLFLSGTAKEKPATAAQIEIENLRGELQRTKDAARIRAHHGARLTDEQVDELLTEETTRAKNLIIAKENEKKNRLEEIRRDKAVRDLACELVRDGKILVSLDGVRLKEITPDLLILCPRCGKPLHDISGALYQFAKTWFWTPDGYQRVVNAFRIYSARSPLTEQGFAGYLMEPCPHCHERVMGTIQVVVI